MIYLVKGMFMYQKISDSSRQGVAYNRRRMQLDFSI